MQTAIAFPQQISVIELKNIVARVKEEINMRSLTIAIRQHCLQQQQTHLKDIFLRFFLKCETKLKKQNNAEWNRIINNQIRKIVGSQKVFAFIIKKTLSSVFAKIQRHAYFDTSLQSDEPQEQFSDLKDMQISEEIKSKTKHFFKWCQFVNQRKQIKRLKSKELEDLKKSKTFNQYSIKFHTFLHWKQHVRKMKQTKEKAITLEKKTQRKQLRLIMDQIKQKIQIIGIEKLLEEAVTKKLTQMHIKSVFIKLNQENSKAKQVEKQFAKPQNIWMHRFFNLISKNSVPLMNKTSLNTRTSLNQRYHHLCLLNSWKGLKAMMKKTLDKVNTIKSNLKQKSALMFFKIKKQRVESKNKQVLLKISSKKLQFNCFLSCMRESTKRQSSFELRSSKINQILTANSIKFIFKQLTKLRSNQNNLKIKLTQLQQSSNNLSKKQLINHLKNKSNKRKSIRDSIKQTKNHYLINLFTSKIKNYRQAKKQHALIKTELAQQHLNKLLKYAWQGFKTYKYYKTGEKEVFDSIVNKLELKILSNAFEQLKEHQILTNNLDKLFKKTQIVVVKLSFITILNRMLSKKMKIKSFTIKQELQLKRKLFNLLTTNSQLLSECQEKAHLVYIRLMKKQLLTHLKQEVKWRDTKNDAECMLQGNSKTNFFVCLKERSQKRNDYQTKETEVSLLVKESRFWQFRESAIQFIAYRKEEEQKSLKVAKKVVKGYIKGMRKNIKSIKEQRQVSKDKNILHQSLINTIKSHLTISALSKMLRQNPKTIQNKYSQLYKIQFQRFINLLKFNHHQNTLIKALTVERAAQAIENFKEHYKMQGANKKLQKNIKKYQLKHSLETISNNLQLQEVQLQDKINQTKEAILKIRQQQSKTIFIQRIKQHHQLKENIMILANQRKKQNCNELIKLYLKQKSKQIKEFIALRHYALNVKRRAMRVLKCTNDTPLLKENRPKTQNNSKLIMEFSIDKARKKSKLIETIQRYNLSRVSRVIR